MKLFILFTLLVGLTLLVSACSGATAATPPAATPSMMEHNMPDMDVSEHNIVPTATPPSETSPTTPSMGTMEMGMGVNHVAPVSSEGVPLAEETVGSQPLAYTQDGEVKVFELTARPVRWPILKDVTVTAWTYNGTVPGPMIRVTEGDRVRIIIKTSYPTPPVFTGTVYRCPTRWMARRLSPKR